MRIAASLGLAATLAFAASAGVRADSGLPEGDWRTINRDLAATRYSPLDQINRSNVSGLEQAWSTPLRAFGNAVPLVIDGMMYVSAGTKVFALDADSGAEIWTHDEPRPEGQQFGGGVSGRGVGYWAGDKKAKPRILVMAGNKLLALDAATGKPVGGFGAGGYVDVGVGYGGTPTIIGEVAVIGAASLESPQGDPGNPRGFDVRTGKKLWEFQTVPKQGQPFNETWGDGWENRGGTNMWGFSATADEASGTVYLPIGGPAHNYYGGDRPGANVFGNSIVAVDARTGAYKWHFQTVHHDLWDSDQPSAGPLVPLTVDGKQETAIATIGKTSYLYVLDAETGVPVHAVEETPV